MDQRTCQTPADEATQADDVELLVRMSDQERDRQDAEAAFALFFERHAEFLRLSCLKYKYSHSSCGAEDVVTLVMTAVFQGEAEFTPPSSTDPDHLRCALRAWLITVARNQYYGQIRKLRFDKNVSPFDEGMDAAVTPEIYKDDADDQPLPITSGLRAKILRFREGLPDIDKLILDRSLDYYDQALRQFNVPPEAARGISAEVGKSIAAVRKRRERIMTAMKASVSLD
jgi:DNA-directed RNA polymerase specialized sigma24 family protein